MASEEELFAAFLAGFEVSKEGANGEYYANWRGDFNENMRKAFEAWLETRPATKGGGG